MPGPRVTITYCTQCKFMLRATWLAQELLTTFGQELGEVAIVPGSGGIFEVTLDGEVIATNRDHGPMPDPAQVKRTVRDRVAPDRKIGHD
ncbi:MAG TPA: SelT/SelW/SelH family protein [Dehalococcoidia bacterium]|jgi:selenoprotein W-related protein|nr:SelT/SelW/SelH family protein [Dehalococcoidia bacterium]